jgi:DNA-binding transcriptional LysR family regulator
MATAEPAPPFAALRVLEAACRLQSYTLTGSELGVTHSAVSQTVRRLERFYGQTMFRREGARMAPSASAHALAQAYREAAGIVVRAGETLRPPTVRPVGAGRAPARWPAADGLG